MARTPKAATQDIPAGFWPVEYIGPRPSYTDGLYGTRIFWEAIGAVQLVPESIAAKMVSVNKDVYRLGDYAGQSAPVLAAKPDTQEQDNRQELDTVIQTMDKVALEGYARQNFGRELDRRNSLDSLRSQVKMLVDQFGAP